jgi:hypothetical protein
MMAQPDEAPPTRIDRVRSDFSERFNALMAEHQFNFGQLQRLVLTKTGGYLISKDAQQHWKHGHSTPGGEHLAAVAISFDVSTDYLLGLTDRRGLGEPDEATSTGGAGKRIRKKRPE